MTGEGSRTPPPQAAGESSASAALERLLVAAQRAASNGDTARARALVRMLTRQYPTDTRAWELRAGLAETSEERATALRHAWQQAGQLAAWEASQPAPAEVVRPAPSLVAPAPPTPAPAASAPAASAPAASALPTPVRLAHRPSADSNAQPLRSLDWRRALVLGLAALLVLLGMFWVVTMVQSQRTPAATNEADATTPPASTAGAAATQVAPIPSVMPSRTPVPPTPMPTIPPPETLPLGALLTHEGWSATLILPSYAQVFSQTIGSVQPRGQFALAVLAIANSQSAARRLPADLFVLVDEQGRSYAPVPEASSAYLAAFGRGQFGDLALEDPIPPGGATYSVPIVFDVPISVTHLALVLREQPQAGWTIYDRAAAPLLSTPQAGP